MITELKLLDLCCGAGGWTKGFMDNGFQCTGVDIKKYKNYPGKMIISDLHDFMINEYFDVIVASPPCTDFSFAKHYAYGTSIDYLAMDLVWRCYQIINNIKPKFHIIENVKGISQFLGEPRYKIKYGKYSRSKTAYLYGNFPLPGLFDSEIDYNCSKYCGGDPRRAEIPYVLSSAFAKTIKHSLVQKNFNRN